MCGLKNQIRRGLLTAEHIDMKFQCIATDETFWDNEIKTYKTDNLPGIDFEKHRKIEIS